MGQFCCTRTQKEHRQAPNTDTEDDKQQEKQKTNDITKEITDTVNKNANIESKIDSKKVEKIEVKTDVNNVDNDKNDTYNPKGTVVENYHEIKLKSQLQTQDKLNENNAVLLPNELSLNKENKSSYIDEDVKKPDNNTTINHVSTPIVDDIIIGNTDENEEYPKTKGDEQNEITVEGPEEIVKGSINNENENIQTKNEIVTDTGGNDINNENENEKVTQQNTTDTQHNEQKIEDKITDEQHENDIEQNEETIGVNKTIESEQEVINDGQQIETLEKNKEEIISDENVNIDGNDVHVDMIENEIEVDINVTKQNENDVQVDMIENENISEAKVNDKYKHNAAPDEQNENENENENGIQQSEDVANDIKIKELKQNKTNNDKEYVEDDAIQESEIISDEPTDIIDNNSEKQITKMVNPEGKEDTKEPTVIHNIVDDMKRQQEIEWKRQSKLIAKQISKQLNSKISETFLDYVSNEFESLEQLKDDLEDVNDVSDSSIIDGIKQRLKENNESMNDINDEKLFIVIQEIVGKVNYHQLKSDILPGGILHIISDFLNAIHLFVNENIVIKLHYNNGNDSFGNYWEESISFNHKTDEKLDEYDDEERIGIVSHYNLNRMAVDNEWTEQQKPFIFELSNELIPKSLDKYLNCNVHKRTRKYIEGIRHEKSVEYVECIKIMCKRRKSDNDNQKGMKDVDDEFRMSILIPCEEMLEIFCMDDKENDMEFTIHESYDESEPHLHENARLTVMNGEDNDPLGVND